MVPIITVSISGALTFDEACHFTIKFAPGPTTAS